MPCTTTCVQPSPSNAHCAATCHQTFGTVSAFDRHRRDGACLDPAGLRMHRDERGVWRWDSVGDGPSARNRSPQTADTPMVGAIGRLEGEAAGLHLIRDGQAVTDCCGRTPFELPGTDRIAVGLGAEATCAARASEAEPIGDGGIGASIVILDEPGGAA